MCHDSSDFLLVDNLSILATKVAASNQNWVYITNVYFVLYISKISKKITNHQNNIWLPLPFSTKVNCINSYVKSETLSSFEFTRELKKARSQRPTHTN